MNKQLFEKQTNSYNPIYPLVRLEDIIETISDKSIQWILNNYNHIYVEYSESVAVTRNKVPQILRRTGIWISYNAGTEVITEYYKGDNKDVANFIKWTNDDNWERFDKIKHLDGSITYQHLSESLRQLIGQGNNITNFPDDEDLEVKNGLLKLKDRDFEPNNFSGLGRVILRKNIKTVNGQPKNVLTQDMINKENTIYIIQYDYYLNDIEITIPEGCVLDFKGGSLNNGTIVGNNTYIKHTPYKIFDLNIKLDGSYTNEFVDIRWFGAISDLDYDNKIGTDVSPYIEKAIEFTNKNNGMYIKVIGRYYLATPIITPAFVHIVGESYENTFTMARSNNKELSYNNPPSLLFVKKGITAFTLIGTGNSDYTYPKATSFTFKRLRIESEACNSNFAEDGIYDNSNESIFITHTATGSPSRFCSIESCSIDGFDKAVNIIPAEKFYKWGTIIGNFVINKTFFYKNNAYGLFIDGATEYVEAFNPRIDTVTGLNVINSKFMCSLHIYDLYGPNKFTCTLFEGRRNQIDCSIRDAYLIFDSCYFEYQALECNNKFSTLNNRGGFSFVGCYNTPNNTNTSFTFANCKLHSYDFNANATPKLIFEQVVFNDTDYTDVELNNITYLRLNSLPKTTKDETNTIVLGLKYKNNEIGEDLKYSTYSLVHTFSTFNHDIYICFYKDTGALDIKVGSYEVHLLSKKGYFAIRVPKEAGSKELYLKGDVFVSNISFNINYPEFNNQFKYLINGIGYLSNYASNIESLKTSVGAKYFNKTSKTEQVYNGESWLNQDGTNSNNVFIISNKSGANSVKNNNSVVVITNHIDLEGKDLYLGNENTIIFKGGSVANAVVHGLELSFVSNPDYQRHFINCDNQFTIAKGQYRYDSAKNKPTWWTGSKWVDATGADV